MMVKSQLAFRLMIYNIDFKPKALKEWHKLNPKIQQQFQSKLKQRLLNPRVLKDKLRSYKNLYKIKLKKTGLRLVYEVKGQEIIILVLIIGKRENAEVYDVIDLRM